MGVVRRCWLWTKKLWRVMRNVDYAIYLLGDAEDHSRTARHLRKQLDMPEQGPAFDPHPNWGDAVHWMEKYGIDFADGGAGFKYLARLPKDRWEHDICPDADPKWFSTWMIIKPEEADYICAWSRWPEVSVAQCVLNAQKAGVI